MDKEIEALLHSLNIQADFPPVQEIHQKEESPPEKKEPQMTKAVLKAPEKTSRRPYLLSILCFFSLLGVSLLSAWGYAYFIQKKDPLPPLRMIDRPLVPCGAFFQGISTNRSSSPFSLIAFQTSAGVVENESDDVFFGTSSFVDDLLVKELNEHQRVLGQQKKELQSQLAQGNVFAERDGLRLFSSKLDTYLRSYALTSALLEKQWQERLAYMNQDEKQTWDLVLHTYGGLPLRGCRPTVIEGESIQNELIESMEALKKEKSLEMQALKAMHVMKLLDRISQDRILSVLIDGKEERKKLDTTIMSLVNSFEKQRDSSGRYSVQEWRALCFLKWVLSKKPTFDWQVLDKRLYQKPVHLSVEENTSILTESSPFCSTVRRIDW